MSSTSLPLSSLDGREVVGWFGVEMALAGGAPLAAEGSLAVGEGAAPLWEHPSMPYLQLAALDLHLPGGEVLALVAELSDGTGSHGLRLFARAADALVPADGEEPGSIYRTRELVELPRGRLRLHSPGTEAHRPVLALRLAIGAHRMQITAGEVEEQRDGSLVLVEPDESLLVQVDGARPGRGSSVR